ncbi:MAG TPA: entericidin A/B family lipoprotein [Arenimonas sp.]|jgi:predicted small secreted protein|nr:entericidin A/B family lipoprotein [Arenimonas sp.]
MKKLVSAVLLVSFALSLSACNTMAGIGKDVEKAGEVVQDAAD